MFAADQALLEIGIPALRMISVSFLLSSPAVVISGVFEALGRGGRSLTVTMLRQLLIIPPLAFLLSPVMGLTGVWIAFPIAEAAASVAAVFLYRGMMKRMEAA